MELFIGMLLVAVGLVLIVTGGKSKGEKLFAAVFGTEAANAGPSIAATGTPGIGIGQPSGGPSATGTPGAGIPAFRNAVA